MEDEGDNVRVDQGSKYALMREPDLLQLYNDIKPGIDRFLSLYGPAQTAHAFNMLSSRVIRRFCKEARQGDNEDIEYIAGKVQKRSVFQPNYDASISSPQAEATRTSTAEVTPTPTTEDTYQKLVKTELAAAFSGEDSNNRVMTLLTTSPQMTEARIERHIWEMVSKIALSAGEKKGAKEDDGASSPQQRIRAIVKIVLAFTTSQGVQNLLQHQPSLQDGGITKVPTDVFKKPSELLEPSDQALRNYHTFVGWLCRGVQYFGRIDSTECEEEMHASRVYGIFLLFTIFRAYQRCLKELEAKDGPLRKHLDPMDRMNKRATILLNGTFAALLTSDGIRASAEEQAFEDYKKWWRKVMTPAKTCSELLEGCEYLLPLLGSDQILTRFTHLGAAAAKILNEYIMKKLLCGHRAQDLRKDLDALVNTSLLQDEGQIDDKLDAKLAPFEGWAMHNAGTLSIEEAVQDIRAKLREHES